MDWYDRKNRRTIGPAVLVENLTGTASAPPPLLTANERRIEHLRRKGLLTFRTALELRRSTIAERQEPRKTPKPAGHGAWPTLCEVKLWEKKHNYGHYVSTGLR